jgi:hypothetical protein
MVRFAAAAKITNSNQIADGIVTKPKLSFAAADLNAINAFMAVQKIYAADKSQLLLHRDSALTQGGSLLAYGADGRLYAAGNGYFDGSNWQRLNTSYPLLVLLLDAFNDRISVMRAAAGDNPATLSEIFRIRNDGRIVVPNMSSIIICAGQLTVGYGGTTTVSLTSLSSAAECVVPRNGYIISANTRISDNTLNGTSYINLYDTFAGVVVGTLITIPSSSSGIFASTINLPLYTSRRYVLKINTSAATSGGMIIYSISMGVA